MNSCWPVHVAASLKFNSWVVPVYIPTLWHVALGTTPPVIQHDAEHVRIGRRPLFPAAAVVSEASRDSTLRMGSARRGKRTNCRCAHHPLWLVDASSWAHACSHTPARSAQASTSAVAPLCVPRSRGAQGCTSCSVQNEISRYRCTPRRRCSGVRGHSVTVKASNPSGLGYGAFCQ